MAESVSVSSKRTQLLITASGRVPRNSIARRMLASAAASSPSPAWAADRAARGGNTAWMSPMRLDVSAASDASAKASSYRPRHASRWALRLRSSLPR